MSGVKCRGHQCQTCIPVTSGGVLEDSRDHGYLKHLVKGGQGAFSMEHIGPLDHVGDQHHANWPQQHSLIPYKENDLGVLPAPSSVILYYISQRVNLLCWLGSPHQIGHPVSRH